ncbi:MAG: YceI family protein [Bacteroidota bacterium]
MMTPSLFAQQNWNVDRQAASVSFEIGTIYGTVEGKFNDFEATIAFDPGNLAASSFSGKINVKTIATGIGLRDRHMRNRDDYFQTKEYPNMTFSTKKIVLAGDKYVATGTMTIKGTSREFEMPFTFDGSTFRATFTLNIDDYNVGKGSKIHDNTTTVKLHLPVSSS